jgi:hypothetical protein
VTITLNGDPFDLAAPLTVTALLAQLDVDPRRVAVEQTRGGSVEPGETGSDWRRANLCSRAINAVADELMKHSEALLARDARREAQLGALEEQIGRVGARIDDLVRALPAARDDG